jgi:hypothetical protein
VVPAGGLAPDRSRWIDARRKFFLPVDGLQEVFRGKFGDGLKTSHAEHQLPWNTRRASESEGLRSLAWTAVPLPVGGLCKTPVRRCVALRYLGQYTPGVAISNHRLVALADGMLTFRWRDSAHPNKK